MKKTTLLFFLMLTTMQSMAIVHDTYSVLLNVNQEWQKHQELINTFDQTKIVLSKNHTQNIQLHLHLVVNHLKQNASASLTPLQRKHRNRLLDCLQDYAIKGVFPTNDYLPLKNPIFIDRRGVHCAVGYLIQQSSRKDLAQNIHRLHKYDYIANINMPELEQWALNYGFSKDELAWIQPAYLPGNNVTAMKNGLNGNVNAIAIDSTTGYIYAGGQFTSTGDGIAASNIAVWVSGVAGFDWIALPGGLNGPVHALEYIDNKLYIGGDFTIAGGIPVKNVAVYDPYSTTTPWSAMGSLDSTVYCFAKYKNKVYAGGAFTDIFKEWDGNQWTSVNSIIYGSSVRALQEWNGELIIGGKFDMATGALRKNLATFDGTYVGIIGMGTPTPVNDLAILNNHLYAACDFYEMGDSCALFAFDSTYNGTAILIPGLNQAAFLNGQSFNCIASYGNKLIIGGNFTASTFLSFGNNIMAYAPLDTLVGQNQVINFASVDGTAKTLATGYNYLYLGGDFTYDSHLQDRLNHVGYIDLITLGIDKLKNASAKIYPNPSTNGMFTLSLPNKFKHSQILVWNTQGQLLLQLQNPTLENEQINLAQLPSGKYIIGLYSNKETLYGKLVIEK